MPHDNSVDADSQKPEINLGVGAPEGNLLIIPG